MMGEATHTLVVILADHFYNLLGAWAPDSRFSPCTKYTKLTLPC